MLICTNGISCIIVCHGYTQIVVEAKTKKKKVNLKTTKGCPHNIMAGSCINKNSYKKKQISQTLIIESVNSPFKVTQSN